MRTASCQSGQPAPTTISTRRLEQEDKLRLSNSSGKQVMDEAGVTRFIQHYQRLTEHGLRTLPDRVDHCLHLGSDRQVTHYTAR